MFCMCYYPKIQFVTSIVCYIFGQTVVRLNKHSVVLLCSKIKVLPIASVGRWYTLMIQQSSSTDHFPHTCYNASPRPL